MKIVLIGCETGEENRFIWDINSKFPDGSINPNFGRPFVATRPGANESERSRETIRVTAFYKHDFGENNETLGKWLGNHTITGLYNDQEILGSSFSYQGFSTSPSIESFPAFFAEQRGNNAARRGITTVHYLGPDLTNLPSPAGANISHIRARQIPDQVETVMAFNRDTQQWQTFQQDLLRYQEAKDLLLSSANSDLQNIKSVAFTLQSYLVDDLLSVQTSWRNDDVNLFRGSATQTTEQGFRVRDSLVIPDVPDLDVSNETFSWGAVLHTPDSFRENLPYGLGLSLHYNESENFRPSGLRVDVLGDTLAPPTGITEERGFSIESRDGKFFLRANWYETSQSNETSSASSQIFGLLSLESRFIMELPALVEAGYLTQELANQYTRPNAAFLEAAGWNEFTDEFGNVVVETNPGPMAATHDFVSKGFEVEMAFNPTPNWTMILSAAKQESTRDNTGPKLQKIIDERLPTWQKFGDVPFVLEDTSFSLLGRAGFNVLNPFNTIKLGDGTIASELRKWRWSYITNYRFTEGRLNGFGVGGAVRWQDSVAIGYPVIEDSVLGLVSDIKNPYFGPEQETYDFWVSYKKRLSDKLDWKIQLNVRNAFGGDGDLIPVVAQPNGATAFARIGEPITWELSNSIKF